MRFWVSWIQPTEDHRPVRFPPAKMLGWWCSGEDASGNATLCALLDANSEQAAKDILAFNWPETRYIEDWRIWDRMADDYVPGDRFPLSDWSPLKEE